MQFLSEYGLFLAKIITTAVFIVFVASFFGALAARAKQSKEKLVIRKINQKFDYLRDTLNAAILSKKALKRSQKTIKANAKSAQTEGEKQKKRIYVLEFKGDIKASAVDNLREEITAVLQVATNKDEIVVKIDSPGGVINNYGLASSQLQRIRDRKVPLITAIDAMAASGGYLMACVADKILAAPFAIVGSIGVVAQLPNFHRLLKKHDIDFEQITAGEYKRTLSMFGENTKKGRTKAKEDVEEAHYLFKKFVSEHRPKIDIKKIATGEIWYGQQATALGLVDQLITSDEYLLSASKECDIYQVSYVLKKKLHERISQSAKACVKDIFLM
jgi:serine protease SohB